MLEAFCVLLVAFWRYPTAALVIGGKTRSVLLVSAPSPDGRFRLAVTRRMAFPATELVDPAVVLTARLLDRNGLVLNRRSARLSEDSDLRPPEIRWNAAEVRLVNFDRRHPRDLGLTLPDNP